MAWNPEPPASASQALGGLASVSEANTSLPHTAVLTQATGAVSIAQNNLFFGLGLLYPRCALNSLCSKDDLDLLTLLLPSQSSEIAGKSHQAQLFLSFFEIGSQCENSVTSLPLPSEHWDGRKDATKPGHAQLLCVCVGETDSWGVRMLSRLSSLAPQLCQMSSDHGLCS